MKTFTTYAQRTQLLLVLMLGLCELLPNLVAAQSVAPTWQWATRATSSTASATDYSQSRCIRVDGNGNVFSAGSFYGTLTLGSNVLTSPGNYDSFLAKYTPTGSVAWVRHLNGSSSETVVKALAVDGSGNSYVAGYFFGGVLVIGPTTLTGGGGFLVKYDPQGTVLWVRGAGYSFLGLACNAAGEVVTIGNFSGTVTLGNTTLTSSHPVSGFVVKYDAPGNVQWAQLVEGVANDEGAVGFDAAGNAYVAGVFADRASFGSITLAGTAGNEDVFLVRYSAAGAPQWALSQPVAGPAGDENVWGLATDTAGNTYLVGVTSAGGSSPQQWFVTHYTPQGTIGWNHLSTLTTGSGLTSIALDATSNVYVSGPLTGSFGIGGLSLASAGPTNTDGVLLSFTPQGAPRWALTVGTPTSTEYAMALAVDNTSLYLTGSVQGTTAFGTLPLPQNSPSQEQFVAKASISSITATRRGHQGESLLIYPNPTRGTHVRVRWPGLAEGPGQLLLYDALGRLALTRLLPTGPPEALVPITSLRPGIYTLHLQTATGIAAGRLVVE